MEIQHRNSIEKRKIRRLRLLQKGGLFTSTTNGSRATRATTAEELRSAYRLVHDVYVASNFIVEKKVASGFDRLRPVGIRPRSCQRLQMTWLAYSA